MIRWLTLMYAPGFGSKRASAPPPTPPPPVAPKSAMAIAADATLAKRREDEAREMAKQKAGAGNQSNSGSETLLNDDYDDALNVAGSSGLASTIRKR